MSKPDYHLLPVGMVHVRVVLWMVKHLKMLSMVNGNLR